MKEKLIQIGELYVKYHKLRKEIADLKYDRTIDFKSCDSEYWGNDISDFETSCYSKLKLKEPIDKICDCCKDNWNKHLKIVALGHQVGGLKYSLNKLIEKL